jgi:HSP20 family protein
MADIVRRDPFTHLRQTMDRLFDDSFFRVAGGRPFDEEGTLPVDISETDSELVVRASLPGFTTDEISVDVNDGVLSIKGQHQEEHEERGERFYRRERTFGAVSRRIALPGIVADAAVEAELKSGVLTLRIALPEKAKPKQIEIKSTD